MDGSTEYGWDLTWPLTRMEKRKITQAQISQDLGKSSSLLGAQTKSESDVVPASAGGAQCLGFLGASLGILDHLGQFNQQ